MYVPLLVVCILILCILWPPLGVAPAHWGYYPSGFAGLLIIVLLVILLTERRL